MVTVIWHWLGVRDGSISAQVSESSLSLKGEGWIQICPRCRYLGLSHTAIGPAHLTAFPTFWHFSYLENIHKE